MQANGEHGSLALPRLWASACRSLQGLTRIKRDGTPLEGVWYAKEGAVGDDGRNFLDRNSSGNDKLIPRAAKSCQPDLSAP